MQRNGRHAFFFGNLAGADKREQFVVNAHAELGRDRNAIGRCASDHGAQDGAQQVWLHRHCGAAAATGDLLRGAAEVEVDVINAILRAQQANSLTDDGGIAAIDLEASRRFVGAEGGHARCLRVAMNQSGGHHHFVDIDEVGRKASTHRTERRVGDTSHRCEHNGWPDLIRA